MANRTRRPGRPSKKSRIRNISGLKNQGSYLADSREQTDSESEDPATEPEDTVDPEDEYALKPAEEDEDGSDCEVEDLGWAPESDGEREVCESLVKMAGLFGDDDSDDEWLPARARKEARRQIARPKEYKKGPDVASKSARTRRRYAKSIKKQMNLTSFGFQVGKGMDLPTPPSPVRQERSPTLERVLEPPESPSPSPTQSTQRQPSLEPASPIIPRTRSRPEDSESDQSSSLDAESEPGAAQGDEDEMSSAIDEDSEAEDAMLDAGGGEMKSEEEIRGWDVLRTQIKDDLKKCKKVNATLTQINQLLIFRNFATLRLKGFGRIAASHEIARQWHEGKGTHFARRIRGLARHYQLFEQLPLEKRGGDRGHSLLNDEAVQGAARQWLTSFTIPFESFIIRRGGIFPM
ncbi:hypothetical protein BV25DRAFT_1919585 [Artomyces pyxidatus]|uniref:Uncharacterized protein n=1 Tax=Artomyces pyxidatus TaxID=48021 RepID=A0ACB8SNW1_9AGAM|nr:hypothetical protein BV25DRAFT_1919585 [Artomyces pyxidatus]